MTLPLSCGVSEVLLREPYSTKFSSSGNMDYEGAVLFYIKICDNTDEFKLTTFVKERNLT